MYSLHAYAPITPLPHIVCSVVTLFICYHSLNPVFQFIAIGATTKKALDEKGLEVFSTAAHPTPEGLLEALLHARQVRQKTT